MKILKAKQPMLFNFVLHTSATQEEVQHTFIAGKESKASVVVISFEI